MENLHPEDPDYAALKQLAKNASGSGGLRQPVSQERGWNMVLSRISGQDGLAANSSSDTARLVPQGRSPQAKSHLVSLPDVRHAGRRFRVFAGMAVAAALCVVAGWQLSEYSSDKQAQGHYSVYTTAKGERATVVLPDSTIVLLNVASRLEVPLNYYSGNRSVKLSGEALFTVVHESAHPFVVTSKSSVTKVLGTTFSVRQYETEEQAEIAVRDGKVMVHTTVLTAGQRLESYTDGHVGPITESRPHQFAFERGVLSLPRMPLSAAVAHLNRWYDATIHIADPKLGDQFIEGQFPAGSVSDMIERLEWTYDVRVQRNGDSVTVYPQSR